MPRRMWLVAEEEDHEESFLYYYRTLGKLASKYGLARWQVEVIIMHSFPVIRMSWNGSIVSPMLISTDSFWDTPAREIDKVVSRWHKKFDSFLYLIEERYYLD